MQPPERVNTMSRREQFVLGMYGAWTLAFLLVLAVTMVIRKNLLEQFSPPATTAIHLVVQAPLSGPQAGMGREIRNGVELALNDAGGALAEKGYQLSLVAYDDEAMPDVAVANAEHIGRDPAALAVVGHLNGGEAMPAADRYARSGLPFVTPASSSLLLPTNTYTNVNRLLGRSDEQALAAVMFARTHLTATTVFVASAQTLYGANLAQTFITDAVSHGLAISGTAVLSGAETYSAAAVAITTTHPSVIYYAGEPGPLATLLDALKASGAKVPVIAGDGADAASLADAVARNGAAVYYTTLALTPADYAVQYPAAQAFVASYKERFGIAPGLYAAEAYDATRLVLAAIDRVAGSQRGVRPTRAQVAVALRQVSLYGLQGRTISFVDGELNQADYFVLKAEAATADAWYRNPVEASYLLGPLAR